MKPPKGLGKGLRALIGEVEAATESTQQVSEIPVNLIDPNPHQPRQTFDEESLQELADSIRQQGLLQPVLVRPHDTRYQLIVGERRWRAAQRAGLESIPAIIRDHATDEEMLELAILENVQRQDLNPIELAQAIHVLQSSCSLTQESIATKLGVSRAHVANTLRLLKLPESMQRALREGKLTAGHARALLSIEHEAEREALFQQFLVDGRPTVRDTEEIVRAKSRRVPRAGKPAADRREQLEIARLEDSLRRKLLTRVKIKRRKRGGVIEIQFYTDDDFRRLLELLEK